MKLNTNNDFEPQIAGCYDLEKTIGKGHYAVVKLARHVFTGEKVAIKIIDKNKLDLQSRDRLYQEVICMKMVQHPNVIRLYDVLYTVNKLYIVQEWADGGDLYDFIMKHEHGLSESVARGYFMQMLSAISYCHMLHVVHRDLKPENVVFFKSGILKITDFGFSNTFTPGNSLETSCGSLAYSAPEILLGDPYDPPKVDIWSLGVILYMLVVGRLPFNEYNDSETLSKIMDCVFDIPKHLSANCSNLITRILCRDPDQRASLKEIMNHQWLLVNDPTDSLSNCSNDVSGLSSVEARASRSAFPLLSRRQLQLDEHMEILNKMADGQLGTHFEIQSALDADEYNYLTATYYLLAERQLFRSHLEEQLANGSDANFGLNPCEPMGFSMFAAESNVCQPSIAGTILASEERQRRFSMILEDEEDLDDEINKLNSLRLAEHQQVRRRSKTHSMSEFRHSSSSKLNYNIPPIVSSLASARMSFAMRRNCSSSLIGSTRNSVDESILANYSLGWIKKQCVELNERIQFDSQGTAQLRYDFSTTLVSRKRNLSYLFSDSNKASSLLLCEDEKSSLGPDHSLSMDDYRMSKIASSRPNQLTLNSIKDYAKEMAQNSMGLNNKSTNNQSDGSITARTRLNYVGTPSLSTSRSSSGGNIREHYATIREDENELVSSASAQTDTNDNDVLCKLTKVNSSNRIRALNSINSHSIKSDFAFTDDSLRNFRTYEKQYSQNLSHSVNSSNPSLSSFCRTQSGQANNATSNTEKISPLREDVTNSGDYNFRYRNGFEDPSSSTSSQKTSSFYCNSLTRDRRGYSLQSWTSVKDDFPNNPQSALNSTIRHSRHSIHAMRNNNATSSSANPSLKLAGAGLVLDEEILDSDVVGDEGSRIFHRSQVIGSDSEFGSRFKSNLSLSSVARQMQTSDRFMEVIRGTYELRHQLLNRGRLSITEPFQFADTLSTNTRPVTARFVESQRRRHSYRVPDTITATTPESIVNTAHNPKVSNSPAVFLSSTNKNGSPSNLSGSATLPNGDSAASNFCSETGPESVGGGILNPHISNEIPASNSTQSEELHKLKLHNQSLNFSNKSSISSKFRISCCEIS